jgi:hypothetical protein
MPPRSTPKEFEADERLLRGLTDPLVADVRRTLDPGYQLRFHRSHGAWEWQSRWSASEEVTAASIPEQVFNEEPRQAALTLVRAILDLDFDHVVEPWPRCPIHVDHPLEMGQAGGIIGWRCRRSSRFVVPLGQWGGLPGRDHRLIFRPATSRTATNEQKNQVWGESQDKRDGVGREDFDGLIRPSPPTL